MTPLFLFAHHPHLDREWPFLTERMAARLGALGQTRTVETVRDVPLHRQADLSDVWGIAWFGGALTSDCVAAAPKLRAIGGMTDNSGRGLPWASSGGRRLFGDSPSAASSCTTAGP